jgi:hypothetical protein
MAKPNVDDLRPSWLSSAEGTAVGRSVSRIPEDLAGVSTGSATQRGKMTPLYGFGIIDSKADWQT